MRGYRFVARALGAVWIASAAHIISPALSAETHCPGASVEVIGASPDESLLVCAGVRDALAQLAVCGIGRHAAIRIEVTERIHDPLGRTIFARYDPLNRTALISPLIKLPPLIANTAYAQLDLRDFYRSMVVHETIHAVLHHLFRRAPGSRAAYEYPAYALQIASLPPGTRESFVRSLTGAADAGFPLLSDVLLSFDPYFFAARAYEQFTRDGNGCKHLVALLDGEDTDFIVTLP